MNRPATPNRRARRLHLQRRSNCRRSTRGHRVQPILVGQDPTTGTLIYRFVRHVPHRSGHRLHHARRMAL